MQSQAYIVLGGGIAKDGVLSPTSRARLDYALELYKLQPKPLVLSGRWSLLSDTPPPVTEAAAMRDYALSQGLAASQLLLEEESMETIGNAYFSFVRHVWPQRWHAVEVVTSAFHAERTQYCFKKVFASSCHVLISTTQDGLSAQDQAGLLAREQALLAFYTEVFGPIKNGNREAILAKLQKLPGYSNYPEVSRAELQAMIANTISLGQTYN